MAEILRERDARPIDAERGIRRFAIERKTRESDVITSFVLRPVDGHAPAPHRAGQHLTLWATLPDGGTHKRNYTISSAPNGETYRISVKREPDGCVSKWLHDEAVIGTELSVAPPGGAFVLPEPGTRPVVMISGGVGVTPSIAMLEAAVTHASAWPIHFIHCTQNGRTHAFREHVRDLASQRGNTEVTIFYSQPFDTDRAGHDFDIAGRLDLAWLLERTPVGEADYFVCGPLSFLRTFVGGLSHAGVSEDRLHYEFFGDVEDLFDEDAGASASQPAAPQPEADVHVAKAIGGFSRELIGDGLLDSAADAVVASDREGLIVLWNAGAQRIFGFTEQEALGASLDIIIPEPFRQRHWDGYRETVASGQSRYGAGDLLAVPGLHKDGHRMSLEFTIALLKQADGSVSGMVAVLRDVSKRFEEMKALKKQIAAQQS